MKLGETRNEAGRDPPINSINSAERTFLDLHQFRRTDLSGPSIRKEGGRGPINSINSINSAKRTFPARPFERRNQFHQFASLWGGCFQLLFCVSYRPCFEACQRIGYFAGLPIVGLRGARAHNLWGSRMLANRVHAGSGATREAYERRKEAWELPGSDLGGLGAARKRFGRPASAEEAIFGPVRKRFCGPAS